MGGGGLWGAGWDFSGGCRLENFNLQAIRLQKGLYSFSVGERWLGLRIQPTSQRCGRGSEGSADTNPEKGTLKKEEDVFLRYPQNYYCLETQVSHKGEQAVLPCLGVAWSLFVWHCKKETLNEKKSTLDDKTPG